MLTTTIYLHNDKDSMWEEGERLGLKDEALRMFRHACSEVKLTLAVDEKTGVAEITAVDGRALK